MFHNKQILNNNITDYVIKTYFTVVLVCDNMLEDFSHDFFIFGLKHERTTKARCFGMNPKCFNFSFLPHSTNSQMMNLRLIFFQFLEKTQNYSTHQNFIHFPFQPNYTFCLFRFKCKFLSLKAV